jgi:hypothetical protein
MDRNENRLRVDVPIEELFETTKGVSSVVDLVERFYKPVPCCQHIEVSINAETPIEEDFWQTVNVVNYPQDIPLGLPENTIWHYVSVCYLNGIVNYVKPLKALFHWDSTKDTKDYAVTFVKHISMTSHTNYLCTDVTLIGETTNDYWIFMSNQDVSDCSIGRFSKELTSLEEVIEAAHELAPEGYTTETLPLPTGWITF